MIIADENIPPEIIAGLRKLSIDVLSVKESFRGMSDEDVIWLSKEVDRIILTEDKDFGEWVFAHKIKGLSVIFLRYHFNERDLLIAVLNKLILGKGKDLYNKFTTVTVDKIRSRDI